MEYWDLHCDLTFGESPWLCQHFDNDDKLFDLVNPTADDFRELERHGMPTVMWGRGSFDEVGYTSLRQNLILFICAMNNEL